MTFLSPIPALIAAAITIPGLLFFYFLKLRRRPVRVSSTLLWEEAVRDLQVNVPFRLIRPTWLLLLQLFILGLFLMALARPAVDLPQGVPERIIFIIDRSASMSARDVESREGMISRLEAAKQRALDSITHLSRSSGASFAVLAFAAEPVLISSFSSDAGAARAAIASIQPTDQPGNLKAALQLAGGLFSGDTDESTPRPRGLATLYSDGSFADIDSLALSGGEFRFQSIGPLPARDLDPDTRPAIETHDNLGIVAIAARREWEDPTVIRIFARVQNASAEPITAPLILTLDGKEVQSIILTVPAATPASAASFDPEHPSTASTPGESAASFKLDTREGGIATVRMDRADALAADNSASVILSPASKPTILIVKPDAADPPGPDWLNTNIEEMQLPRRTMTASQFAQEANPRFSLIIFDRVSPAATPAIPSLSFGAGIPGLEARPSPARGTYVINWRRTHPVLRSITLDGVYVGKPLSISTPKPDDELARGLDGSIVAESSAAGARHIVVGFELSQSNWPIQVSFPIFLASAIDYLTLRADEHAGGAFTTAEPASLRHAAAGRITLDGPIKLDIAAPAAATTDSPISVGILERAGVYRVAGLPDGTPAQDRTIAVNVLDQTESSLAVRQSLRVSGQVVASAAGDSGPREIWPWLIAAALVLLSIEWFLNAWQMKV